VRRMPFPLPLPPPSLPRLPLSPQPVFYPFPPLLFFPSSVEFSKDVWAPAKHCKLPIVPSEKMAASCKSWRRPNTLGLRDLQVGEDASHGSRRAVAPMPAVHRRSFEAHNLVIRPAGRRPEVGRALYRRGLGRRSPDSDDERPGNADRRAL